MKICSKCLLNKPLYEYYVCSAYVGGYKHVCKICARASCKNYYENNIEKVQIKNANWKQNNKEYVNKKQREWRTKTNYMSNYLKNKNNRIAHNLRNRLSKLIKGEIKHSSMLNNLGCSKEHLICHLESQFESWMNWDNYGKCNPIKKTWNIDHIEPLIKFDLTDPEQLKKACYYTNLRPLLAKKNSSKGGR